MPKAMVVAGVMSGTSADGVDVALVRVSPGRGGMPELEVLGHWEFPYAEAVRAAVLRAAGGEMKVAEVSRLHWELGAVYAECVEEACVASGVTLELVGMHGQTIYHEAPRATWQIGEAAVVRQRLGVPVISDFRPADMAAGGQGAPLVPMLDYCMFRSETKNRVLLNLGGIANLTAIRAGAGLEDVIAFDTGPANMVVDALMQRLYGRNYDCGGGTAGRGEVLDRVVVELLEEPYYKLSPPKSCGREQFGAAFADRVYALCEAAGARRPDVVATAAEVTVRSVVEAYARWCEPRWAGAEAEVVVAGGGARNEWMMRRLRDLFGERGVRVMAADEVGVAAQAKEAVAFALLGWLSWHGLAGNVPAATGAGTGVVLGKISW